MLDPLIPTPASPVQPLSRWTLPRVKKATVEIDGIECDAFICKANGYAYGLPDGFSTGAMMNLNLSDNRAIADFVERYGLPVSPYANRLAMSNSVLSKTIPIRRIQWEMASTFGETGFTIRSEANRSPKNLGLRLSIISKTNAAPQVLKSQISSKESVRAIRKSFL